MVNPLAEDKVYIVWTISNKNEKFTDYVSEVLCTTQNILHAEQQVEEYSVLTDDDVFLTTIVLGINPVYDTEDEQGLLYVGGEVRIGE